jgi:hypothetical protein
MELPWSSWALLVVPPVVLFAVALVHWLWAPREDETPPAGRGEA